MDKRGLGGLVIVVVIALIVIAGLIGYIIASRNPSPPATDLTDAEFQERFDRGDVILYQHSYVLRVVDAFPTSVAWHPIENIMHTGNRISVDVSYLGGCGPHVFTLYVLERQNDYDLSNVRLAHDGSNDLCDSQSISETAVFELL